ncbi:competence protein ComGF [Streptococcus pneumoniae 2080076]|nr:competence protein ComGF [Streptococcus pneumoniae 2080076]
MVQNSCWQSKSHKVKAFTLLESLLALIVISGGLLLFQTMSQLLISEVRYQQQSEQKEWLLFVDQLEAELDRSQFEKVEGNRLYMKQDGKDIAIGKSKSDDFRKTDASGRGYQPMVYGLKSAQITEDNQLVHFRFQFQKGLEREFIYRVEKEKVKAGVLLYAVTIAAIFSLLLQFYLNRQVAHYQDYALNKEKLVAFAMAKRTKDKAEQESGEQVFNLGQVSYQNKKTSLVTTVRTSKSQYEFLFPSVKIKEEKRDKKEEVATDSSEKAEKKSEEKPEKKENS